MMKQLFTPPAGRKARAAILMSGSGSNAEVLLRHIAESCGAAPWTPELIFTDRPERCRAREISEKSGVRMEACDIFDFYAKNGESAIALVNPKRRELRDAWSAEVAKILARHEIDFLLLAGFVPLSNVTETFPALNVHPGDLTVEKDGRRAYTGLHRLPVERAILDGCGFLRSSVILAQTYSGSGKNEVDSGPLLAVSPQLAVDLRGRTLAELREIAAKRAAARAQDALAEVADWNIERLKVAGDHVIFAPAADAFAAGRYAVDGDGVLMFDGTRCRSVEFSTGGGCEILPL